MVYTGKNCTSPLYNETTKRENFFNEKKNAKIAKQSHTYKSFASSYNINILISFSAELQIKDTESAVRSKVIDLLSELREFKFVSTLVIELKKIASDNVTKYITFYSETVINESNIDHVFDQYVLRLYQTYKNIFGKVRVGLLTQS